MFHLFETHVVAKKRKALIKWVYNDEDMQEAGEDYLSMAPKLEWKFIEKK